MNQTAPHKSLQNETSPYLLQHADNPVDWYPWNEEALRRAREEHKPILLSIGYSACHWCHVMAHESFEDPETARLMNAHYVNIKVDREERPDLDRIYQLAHQLLTQRAGGWPLTMFLSPDTHIPFFGGTYFPKEPRYNMPAFRQILQMASDYFHQKQQGLEQQNNALQKTLDQLGALPASETALTPDSTRRAITELEHIFDPHEGGFGQAPKFPHCTDLELLLRHQPETESSAEKQLSMFDFTLRKMATGGIYDQLGGGFCRYSVDDFWQIPHFEKMLYDNGPLLALYAQAWQRDRNPMFARVAEDTARWVMDEMQSSGGGYFSSLDADSEGHEGTYYIWDREAVKSILSPEEFAVTAPHYGLNRPANFEGKWHLFVAHPLPRVSEELGVELQQASECLESARQKLLAVRSQRQRPGRDDKILCSWNALMIRGMVVAGRIFERQDWIASARRAFDFIHREMWQAGRLLATSKDGRSHLNAYLDDYAYLLDAGIQLLQNDWDDETLAWLQQLADTLLEEFEDKQAGGFYFTGIHHESLIQRPKPVMDESMPAGNGIAAASLLQLGQLLGRPEYTDAAMRTLNVAAAAIERVPHAHASLLNALELAINPPRTIMIRGPQSHNWQQHIQRLGNNRDLCFALGSSSPSLLQLAAPSDSRQTIAQLCSGTSCHPPATTLEALQLQLEQLQNQT